MDDESKMGSSKHITILTMNVFFLNWMHMKISTWSGSWDGQKPLKSLKSSTNSPYFSQKTRCRIGLKKNRDFAYLNQMPSQRSVASEMPDSPTSTGRKYPERFSDDIFRDSLPELEFRLEEASEFHGPIFYGKKIDRNCFTKKHWVSSSLNEVSQN